jgi:A/G-specific adenine glycosylase
VDGNVARVLSRLFALDARREPNLEKRLWRIAGELVTGVEASSWNQALMELGATVCLPAHPRCDSCPIQRHCAARARGLTEALPRAKTKKPPPVVRRAGFVLVSRGRVLVGKRGESGLFAGMWEPPHLGEHEGRALGRALARRTKGRVKLAGHVTHVLSHRRIEMIVYAGLAVAAEASPIVSASRDYVAFAWVPRRLLCGGRGERPITSLAWKILAKGAL